MPTATRAARNLSKGRNVVQSNLESAVVITPLGIGIIGAHERAARYERKEVHAGGVGGEALCVLDASAKDAQPDVLAVESSGSLASADLATALSAARRRVSALRELLAQRLREDGGGAAA